MKILDIITKSVKPPLYEEGTAMMWNDPYISKQLLNIHLNPDIDLASRKRSTIESTADWILGMLGAGKKAILDLGCGPGLYTEIYARNGHRVTGVDISKSSIDYAKGESNHKKLDIDYVQSNYLEWESMEDQYDLITMIYTDLGVLLPEARNLILGRIYRMLKKDGLFIFDVLNDKELESKVTSNTWEAAEGGFWRASTYLALSNSFLYQEERVILYQHLVMDERNHLDIYRFWTHFFSHQDLSEIMTKVGFDRFTFHEDVLPAGDAWSGGNVTFCVARK